MKINKALYLFLKHGGIGRKTRPTHSFTPSHKFRAALRKARRRAKAIHLRQGKVVNLSNAENVKTGGMWALKRWFRGRNSAEQNKN